MAEGVTLQPTVVGNTTDPVVCGEKQTLQDVKVSEETRGLANVIVALEGVPGGSKPGPTTLVLDNRDCRFEPHVAVLTAGSTIEATNSDTVLHTTHLYGPREVNFSLPAKGVTQSRVLSEPGIYAVKCDVHGWMQAFVRVDDHPFHAVTGEEGRFTMEGVPAGTYTLEAWHERLGSLEVTVKVEAHETAEVELEYRAEQTK